MRTIIIGLALLALSACGAQLAHTSRESVTVYFDPGWNGYDEPLAVALAECHRYGARRAVLEREYDTWIGLSPMHAGSYRCVY